MERADANTEWIPIDKLNGGTEFPPKEQKKEKNSRPTSRTHKEPTLEGHELVLFVVLYALAVVAIVILFEVTMPVLFNPNYPEFSSNT
uniref:Uncharacterized protein n=1 Tax=Parascaris univalens TaxID=6257 RepID=A0A915BHI7_PARUN